MNICHHASRALAVVAVLMVCGSSPALGKFSSEEPSEEVILAAKQGLSRFLRQMRPTSLASFGFSSGDDLKKAALGDAFKLHTILPSALKTYSAGQPVESIVTETSQWYFPVTLDGDVRALLIVDRMGGRWKAVSFGYSPLAREIADSGKQWPKAKGYHARYISVPQAYEFLFSVSEQGPDNMTSLMSRPAAAGLTPQAQGGAGQNSRYAALGKAAELVERLRSRVEQNLRAFPQRSENGTAPR